jgi:hypothetical protein
MAAWGSPRRCPPPTRFARIAGANSPLRLPRERQGPLDAAGGHRAHGYDDRKYGKTCWTPIEKEYCELVEKRREAESTASGEAGQKNLQEKPLRKVLRALINLIKAYCHNTY